MIFVETYSSSLNSSLSVTSLIDSRQTSTADFYCRKTTCLLPQYFVVWKDNHHHRVYHFDGKTRASLTLRWACNKLECDTLSRRDFQSVLTRSKNQPRNQEMQKRHDTPKTKNVISHLRLRLLCPKITDRPDKSEDQRHSQVHSCVEIFYQDLIFATWLVFLVVNDCVFFLCEKRDTRFPVMISSETCFLCFHPSSLLLNSLQECVKLDAECQRLPSKFISRYVLLRASFLFIRIECILKLLSFKTSWDGNLILCLLFSLSPPAFFAATSRRGCVHHFLYCHSCLKMSSLCLSFERKKSLERKTRGK